MDSLSCFTRLGECSGHARLLAPRLRQAQRQCRAPRRLPEAGRRQRAQRGGPCCASPDHRGGTAGGISAGLNSQCAWRRARHTKTTQTRSAVQAQQVNTNATQISVRGRAGMAQRPRGSARASPTGRARHCGRPWTTSSSGRWCCSRSATCSSRVRPGRARPAGPSPRTRSQFLRFAGLCHSPPCAAAVQQQAVWSFV